MLDLILSLALSSAPRPILVTQQTQIQETIEQWRKRQNQPGSELNQLYAKTYIETYCDHSISTLTDNKKEELASQKAFAITSQWNEGLFFFFPDISTLEYLSQYKCP